MPVSISPDLTLLICWVNFDLQGHSVKIWYEMIRNLARTVEIVVCGFLLIKWEPIIFHGVPTHDIMFVQNCNLC
jgi:hypothetical protein